MNAPVRAELARHPKNFGTTSQILHNNWKLYYENFKGCRSAESG
jgi:hypothetical protein